MPTPGFIPLIGSGFDALAQQQQYWAGHNAQVEQGNLARLSDAQQVQNAWLARLAAMRQEQAQQDVATQMSANELAQRALERRRAEAIQGRQFDIGTGLEKERIAAEDRRTKAQYDFPKLQEAKALDQVAKYAQFAVKDVQDTGDALDTAQKRYTDAMNSLNLARSEQEAKLPKGTRFDPKLKEFVPSAIATDADRAAVAQANANLAKSAAEFQAAENTYQIHLSNFDTLRKQSAQNGLQIGKRGDKYVIYSPAHDRTWSVEGSKPAPPPPPPPGAAAAAAVAPTTGTTRMPIDWASIARAMMIGGTASTGGGFAALYSPEPKPAPAAAGPPLPPVVSPPAAAFTNVPVFPTGPTNAFKVGRFIVVPQQ